MSTSDLAARLYERWRQKQDLVQPITAGREGPAWSDMGEYGGRAGGHQPRPVWRHLDTVQQNVWRAVALEATGAAADALGAR